MDSNPPWIIFGLARQHSNPCAELIFDGALPLVGGSRLSTCAPMSFDRSDNRIIDIHWPPRSPKSCFSPPITRRRSSRSDSYPLGDLANRLGRGLSRGWLCRGDVGDSS